MKSYSVSQLNSYLKKMFQSDYLLSSIQVEGELSNVKYHSSGHIYFTLKDEKSQVACVMFAANRYRGLKFKMREGQSVCVRGNVDLYERDGKYQLYAGEVTLAGTGRLYERFLELKEMLEDEGLFSPLYKKRLPLYARKVGIVTAETGAAVQDIIHISKRRNPYVELVLYPAKVQGEGAKESIVAGIHAMEAEKPDVIIIGRGGGSIEDLWAFNEECVARVVFNCEIPIISAVGHETDVTISDYVADLRAPTPSAAAELAVCNIHDVLYTISEFQNSLTRSMEQKLSVLRLRLGNYNGMLKNYNPVNQLNVQKKQFENLKHRLSVSMEKRIQKDKYRLSLCAERLGGLSPLLQLQRGYSYVTDKEGRNVNSVEAVSEKDLIFLAMRDGTVSARVTGKEKKMERVAGKKEKQ